MEEANAKAEAALKQAEADKAAALAKAAKEAEDTLVAERYNAHKPATPEETPEQKAKAFARLEALGNQVLKKK